MDEVVIADGPLEVVVLPEAGARLHRVRAFGHDIILTPDDPATHLADPFFWGSYVMAPWCNRIEARPTAIGSRTVDLASNFPDGSAIHGQVYLRPWTRADDGSFVVSGGGDGWPWTYDVRQAHHGRWGDAADRPRPDEHLRRSDAGRHGHPPLVPPAGPGGRPRRRVLRRQPRDRAAAGTGRRAPTTCGRWRRWPTTSTGRGRASRNRRSSSSGTSSVFGRRCGRGRPCPTSSPPAPAGSARSPSSPRRTPRRRSAGCSAASRARWSCCRPGSRSGWRSTWRSKQVEGR